MLLAPAGAAARTSRTIVPTSTPANVIVMVYVPAFSAMKLALYLPSLALVKLTCAVSFAVSISDATDPSKTHSTDVPCSSAHGTDTQDSAFPLLAGVYKHIALDSSSVFRSASHSACATANAQSAPVAKMPPASRASTKNSVGTPATSVVASGCKTREATASTWPIPVATLTR